METEKIETSLKSAFLILSILMISISVSAFSITWINPSYSHSSSDNTVSGTLTINVSMSNSSDVSQTWFWHNTTSGFKLIGDRSNATADQTYWSTSFDTTEVDDSPLRLKVNSTNTSSFSASNSTNVSVDNSAPSMLKLRNPKNGTIVSKPVDILASWEDDTIGTSRAMYNITDDSGLHKAGTLNDTMVDLSGLSDGVYRINLNATDLLGHTTVNMSAVRILVDNNPPELDVGSTTPSNGSKTGEELPSISFNLTDFTEVDYRSIKVWLERNDTSEMHSLSGDLGFNKIKGWNGNSTVFVKFKPESSLSDGLRYNVSITANDTSNHRLSNKTFWFRTDFSSPSFDGNKTYGTSLTRDGAEWFKDSVIVQIECSSRSGSPMKTYNISSKFGQDKSVYTSDNKANLTFNLDDGDERNAKIDLSCADEAGHSTTRRLDVFLDNRTPDLGSRTPSPRFSVTESKNQLIEVKITDKGAGFHRSNLTKYLEPEFNGEPVSSDDYNVTLKDSNTTALIRWYENTSAGQSYTVYLNSTANYLAMDRFGYSTEIGSWSFDVTSSVDSNDDIGSNRENRAGSVNPEFVGLPSRVSIVPGRSTKVEIEVRNVGNITESFQLNATTSSNFLGVSIEEGAFELSKDEKQTALLSIESDRDFSDSGTVDISLNYGPNSKTASIQIEEKDNARRLDLKAPRHVDVSRGGTALVSLEVVNTGILGLKGLSASLERFMKSSSPVNFGLDPNSSIEVELNLSVSEDTGIGIYQQTLLVSGPRVSKDTKIDVRVQPVREEVKQNISSNIQSLKERIEDLENVSRKEKIGKLVSEAETAIEGGNYARARMIEKEIRDLLKPSESGEIGEVILNVLWYLLVVILAVGVIAGAVKLFQSWREGYRGRGSVFSELWRKLKDKLSTDERPRKVEKKKVKFRDTEDGEDRFERER
ncbi:MAG: hypothetical protein SVV03_00925 [Candidatus Nanohaloarchaea archaeon]|nr:hypothetical protein [Candidatus Nanohaloarchaea archaeon]